MVFDVPSGRILPVDQVDVVLEAGTHPFERDNAGAIAANWRGERECRPALFDGTVALLSELRYREGRLSGRCHAVRYSTFLYWRRNRTLTGAGHAFAHAMPVGSDGALVAIRMAPHTVNAGKVYFAAGSFEPEDFPGGRVDLGLNMAREVLEETGLNLAEARAERRHYALATANGTVVFRRYRFRETANELARRIGGFVAAQPNPEIVGPVVIRSAADLPEGLMPHMPPLLAWHFVTEAEASSSSALG